ncbi:hypothetical protein C8Q79DRAFT_497395 [Trametes meyenii]|nr:hypothetical protein C8Q79DRAFT_497395 [Trametes meyenii]
MSYNLPFANGESGKLRGGIRAILYPRPKAEYQNGAARHYSIRVFRNSLRPAHSSPTTICQRMTFLSALYGSLATCPCSKDRQPYDFSDHPTTDPFYHPLPGHGRCRSTSASLLLDRGHHDHAQAPSRPVGALSLPATRNSQPANSPLWPIINIRSIPNYLVLTQWRTAPLYPRAAIIRGRPSCVRCAPLRGAHASEAHVTPPRPRPTHPGVRACGVPKAARHVTSTTVSKYSRSCTHTHRHRRLPPGLRSQGHRPRDSGREARGELRICVSLGLLRDRQARESRARAAVKVGWRGSDYQPGELEGGGFWNASNRRQYGDTLRTDADADAAAAVRSAAVASPGPVRPLEMARAVVPLPWTLCVSTSHSQLPKLPGPGEHGGPGPGFALRVSSPCTVRADVMPVRYFRTGRKLVLKA